MTQTIQTTKRDLGFELAEHVANTTYNDLPVEAVEAAKKSVLDTLGVTLGATGTSAGLRELSTLILEAGGAKESTILGFGGRVPAWMAAFVNGASSHGLDYDDVHDGKGGHPSAPVLAAGLAMAERTGKTTGKDFITAFVLGQDLFTRMTVAFRPMKVGFQGALTFGVFTTTLTCGKLLGLDAERLFSGLGIAACKTGGPVELITNEGSELRGMYNAFAARDGVLSALMAERGIGGIRHLFEGEKGFLKLYYNEYNREAILGDLGKSFAAAEISYKPWPCCREAHPHIEATLNLIRTHKINPDDIESIRVFVGDFSSKLCEPLAARQRPATTMDAKFSLPFTIGVAIARRKLEVNDFTPEGIKNPQALRFARLVTPVFDPAFNNPPVGLPGGQVEIRTRKGQIWSERVDFAYGHPRNPIDWEHLIEKFMDCAAHSAKRLPETRLRQVIEMVKNLDQVDRMDDIARLLG